MTLSFFIGSHTPFNMQRFTRNLGNMLTSDFDLHLITTNDESLPEETRNSFDIYGSEYPDTTRGEIKAIYSYLKNNSPDVVTQVTKPPKHGLIASALGKQFDVPTVYRLSGDRFGAYKVRPTLQKPIYFGYNNIFGRVPLQLSDYYISLGNSGRQSLVNRGVPEDRITILPPAIDSTKFQPDLAPVDLRSVPDDRQVVLFVGRLIRLKGVETLESIIPDVVDQRPDLHFVFVGDPDETLDVPSAYRDHITIVGAVPPDQMPHYYSLADVLVHPSLTEGVPLVLIEALLSEVPVIARSVGDIPDITQNTFQNESELKALLDRIGNLPLDDGYRFSIRELSKDYIQFYSRFI